MRRRRARCGEDPGQVRRGSSTSAGTPGHAVGTATLNKASGRVGISDSPPARAARTIARVLAMEIRCPTPYGPPLQPVFTSQTATSWVAILSPRSLAYTLGGKDMNGAPKPALNVACGSVTPFSVPATLAVYP